MAVRAFLQEEKKTAQVRSRQCGEFLAHKVEGSGILEDSEVRQALYELITLTHCPCRRFFSAVANFKSASLNVQVQMQF